jgi:hypothetical protein
MDYSNTTLVCRDYGHDYKDYFNSFAICLGTVHDYKDYIKPTSICRDLLMTIWTTSMAKIEYKDFIV